MLLTRVAISKQQATLCWSQNWIRQQYLNNLKERGVLEERSSIELGQRCCLVHSSPEKRTFFPQEVHNDEQKTPVVMPLYQNFHQFETIRDHSRRFSPPINECKTEPSSLKSFFIQNDDTRDGDRDWNVSWWSLVISVTAFCSPHVMNCSRSSRTLQHFVHVWDSFSRKNGFGRWEMIHG